MAGTSFKPYLARLTGPNAYSRQPMLKSIKIRLAEARALPCTFATTED